MFTFKKTIIALSLSLLFPLSFAQAANEGEIINPALDSAVVIKGDKPVVPEKSEALYFVSKTEDGKLNIIYSDFNKTDANPNNYVIELKQVEGMYVFPRYMQNPFVPYEVVTHRGYYPNVVDLDKDAVKIAAEKGAFAYQISRVEEVNSDGENIDMDISLYNADAPLRHMGSVYYTYNGHTARKLPLGMIKQMNPTSTFSFDTDASLGYALEFEAAKQAIDRGAKAFYISNIQESSSSVRKTVDVNIY
ncbi:DUF1471 domain-containing protein [Zophobihabitans entericus]|uniref:DUF1471 domain-containing protein n=1 Tax=Zophobihabitans entericus TaxID=1635327 RepID=A0A6G9ID72_9GAMM|nr:DUF1471 domain-containing protein [Zophobihabitans entericus]QIQ21772.1 DUF1471 domain-containing protein [Zophobihabitans entericus]